MTYSVFAQPQEQKPRTATGYQGIFVVEESSQPLFTAIVKETLKGLKNTPNGGALLQAIAKAAPSDNRGYNVLIHRVSISYDMATQSTVRPRGGRSFAGGSAKVTRRDI